MKAKASSEAKFLSLLERILPKATNDPAVAARIYEEVAKEVRLVTSLESFEKFCQKGSLPDAEPETLDNLKDQLAGNFGEENVVVLPPDEADDRPDVSVEISLPDRTVMTRLKVTPPGTEPEGPEAPFVPFPVALPNDPELVWLMARRENLGPDEANRALNLIEEEFWATKKGQNLQREGVEKTFAEFISNVPAAPLKESGLKRFHKDPETLKILHLMPTEAKPQEEEVEVSF